MGTEIGILAHPDLYDPEAERAKLDAMMDKGLRRAVLEFAEETIVTMLLFNNIQD